MVHSPSPRAWSEDGGIIWMERFLSSSSECGAAEDDAAKDDVAEDDVGEDVAAERVAVAPGAVGGREVERELPKG